MRENENLVIDFGNLSEHQLWTTSEGRIDILLSVANSFLEKIPSELLPDGKNRVLFEVVTNGFLFFIVGARDELLQKINRNLGGIIPSENDVTLYNLKQALIKNKENENFVKIHELLNNCTQEPYKRSNYVGDFERSKSWLWELNNLRVRITHDGILFLKSESSTIDQFLTLCVTNDIEEKNPYQYFKSCYEKFLELKKSMEEKLS